MNQWYKKIFIMPEHYSDWKPFVFFGLQIINNGIRQDFESVT